MSINNNELNAVSVMLERQMRETYDGSKISYDLWFKKFELRELNQNKAIFVCESKFYRDIIAEKFTDFISSSLSVVLGYKPEIEIGVDESLLSDINSSDNTDKETYSESTDESQDEKIFTADKQFAFNENYTFENFVVGASNTFAHAAALNVANYMSGKAKSAANPLFIWGPSGLGKTHLMYAIANRALQKNPEMNIICVKGEDFMNEFVESLRVNKINEFKTKYRCADMLLVDDIQYIATKAGKDATQTEFFHTFDALYENGKQIIITSDCPPKDLDNLVPRIRSRFEAGLLADIQPPDYELRLAILNDKIKRSNIDVSIDVVNFLAKNLQDNIRQLEGVVKKLAMSTLLTGNPVNMEMVINTVPEYLGDAEPTTDTVNRIIESCSKHFSVTVQDIMGDKRSLDIKNARNVSMYIIQEITKQSLSQIGSTFSRDHSTVHSNISKVKTEMLSNPVFEAKVNEIIKDIKKS